MRSYYRCSICHNKVVFEVSENNLDTIIRCSGGKGVILDKKYVYRCVSYSWFERTYLTIRGVISGIRNIINEK